MLRQSEFLTRCGINPAALKGKGHACQVIDRVMQRRAAGLAPSSKFAYSESSGARSASYQFKRAGEFSTPL